MPEWREGSEEAAAGIVISDEVGEVIHNDFGHILRDFPLPPSPKPGKSPNFGLGTQIRSETTNINPISAEILKIRHLGTFLHLKNATSPGTQGPESPRGQ